ncbi:MAG: DUF4278 domain-containing protein [Cyanophyceae cyanobacterium]
MKLIYRGVPYSGDEPKSASGVAVGDRPAHCQGYVKATIKPHFPLFKYLKQLFQRSEAKPVIDPVTFWYGHKRQYLNFCLLLNELEVLERCWYLTLSKAQKTAKPAQPIQLKYRGVTYYR